MEIITPEQQIRNVMTALKKRTDLPRTRQPTEEIRATVKQLESLIEQYFRGELETITLQDGDSLF
jgi:hypothetical protein